MVEDVVRSRGYLMLGSRFKRIGERLQGDTQRIIDAHGAGVQASQFTFLGAIDGLGPLAVGELAEAIGITQPGATRAVGQLAKLGLVKLRPGRDDQRQRIVSLTAKGERAVDLGKREIWPRVVAAVADLCDGLSGSLLDQLAGIEDGLAERPLERRPAKRRG
jgi:DNA-binding MarR family transcriptional regulator